MKPVLLWTDVAVFAQVLAALWYVRRVRRTPHLAATWLQAFRRPSGSVAATVLCLFGVVGFLDSLHYRTALPVAAGAPRAWSTETVSVLDAAFGYLRAGQEATYSAPFATFAYQKVGVEIPGGGVARRNPRLAHAGTALVDPVSNYDAAWAADVARRGAAGLAAGAVLAALCALLAAWQERRRRAAPGLAAAWHAIRTGRTSLPVRAILLTLALFFLVAGPLLVLSGAYHVMGTDRTGNDILLRVLKSVRTALVIGTMTTLVTLPISVGLGLLAGYLRGWVDLLVQYVYTVINSVPYVLLIAAAVLLLIVFIDAHPEDFPTVAQRADARLFFLCVILGLSSWTDLCRLVRGEVLKLRELDYVQAAQAFGVSNARIMRVHLLPNLMHVILINVVIRFSSLVLAEAALSYVGVGVDPAMASFGTLIAAARLELGRDPVIWWTLTSAFVALLALVLAANYFADAVRDAFDPRSARVAGGAS